MRIAMVFDDLGIGGVERIGVNYAKMLVSLGHEVTIINLQAKHAELEEEFLDECNIIHAKMPLVATPDFYLPIVRKWWWGKYLYSGIYFISKACLLGFRALHMRRKSFDIAIAFSGHVRDLTYVAYEFIDAKRKLAWVHGAIYDFFLMSYSFKNLYLKVRNLCVLSEQNQQKALKFCDVPDGNLNITKIHNPIEQETTISTKHVKALKDRYGDFLLMVGRFDIDKDQATVLRAQKVLRNQYSMNPYFLYVGDGPTRANCERLAKELGVDDRAVFCGTQSDIDDFYAAAFLTLHSSPSEGLPTVLLESMRNDTPIVATKSLPGVPEILGDDKYGLTCEIGNPEDMASKIVMMQSDSSLYEQYRIAAHQRIDDFSFARISEELKDILYGLRQ